MGMFESRKEKLIPFGRFVSRLLQSLVVAGLILAAALFVGIMGYHFIAGFGWVDALLNAAMILTGMGPVDRLTGNAAKLFAAGYALLSGLAFVTMIGIVLVPMFHRVLHKFHIDC